MNKIKIRLYIKVLPDNDLIPCHGMEYSIVPKGKKHEEYLWDMKVPTIEEVNQKIPKKLEPLSFPNSSNNINWEKQAQNIANMQKNNELIVLKSNRRGKTDTQGFTKEMYLPNGEYDVWIKRSDSDWELAYFLNGSKGFKVNENIKLVNYQIRNYYRYRVLNFNNKPFDFLVDFETYTFDKSGKEKKIQIKGLKTKKTDKHGFTPVLYSPDGHLVFVKFKFANQEVKPEKKEIDHYATLSKNNFIVVKLKSVASISKDKISTTVNLQGTGKPPVILNTLREEMVVLSSEDYAVFEKESSKLDIIFANAKEAKVTLSEAIKSGNITSIKAAEDEIKKAEKAIEDELNKNFKNKADLTEVITFEARQKKNPNGNTQEFDLRRRYLRTDRYMQLQQKKKNKESFKVTALGKELKSLKDPIKVNKSIIEEEFKKVNLELAAYSKSTGTKVWDFTPFSGAFVEQVKLSDNLTLDTQSQWLRCVASAGVSSSLNWKPGSNEFSAKVGANAQCKLVLFEGKTKLTYCIPSEKGWMLNYQDIDLGAFRLIYTTELYGFAGAKIAAGIGIEISKSAEGQKLAATGRRNKNPSLANNLSSGRPKFVPMDKDDSIIPGSGAGSEGQIDVFAGAEAGLKMSADFQWLSPEAEDFVSLASLAPDFAVSAGIGAGVNFKLFYWEGQFRIRAKAALCFGVGAKGAIDLSIDFKKIFEMVKWVYYQLMRAGFRTLSFIVQDAFERFSNVAVLALGEDSVTTTTLLNISTEINKFNMKYALAEKGKDLAITIIKKPEWLKYGPPNAKGILIYQMTRHNKVTHWVDKPDYGITPFLPTFKKAVIAIFETVSTEGEWLNILQRIDPLGAKTNKRIDYIEKQLLGFLHDGLWSRGTDFIKEHVLNNETGSGSEFVEQYEKLRSKVVKTVPLHEKVPMNNPRELKKLREKMIEQPNIINEDSLSAVNFEPVQPLEINNRDAEIFLANANQANSDGSELA